MGRSYDPFFIPPFLTYFILFQNKNKIKGMPVYIYFEAKTVFTIVQNLAHPFPCFHIMSWRWATFFLNKKIHIWHRSWKISLFFFFQYYFSLIVLPPPEPIFSPAASTVWSCRSMPINAGPKARGLVDAQRHVPYRGLGGGREGQPKAWCRERGVVLTFSTYEQLHRGLNLNMCFSNWDK